MNRFLAKVLPFKSFKSLRPSLFHLNTYSCIYTPQPLAEHFGYLTMRASRRSFLNKAVLNQNKQVIFGELRKPEDTLAKLKASGKCAAVILPQSGNKQEEIDLVVDGKHMIGKIKHENYGLERVFVRVEGKDYKCVLRKVLLHSDQFILKTYFQEYVPGKPNKLTIPIQITHFTENPYIQSGRKFEIGAELIDVICYNEEYPNMFYADISYCTDERFYRLGDLANTFPPGMLISPNVNPHTCIIKISTKGESDDAQKDALLREYMEKTKVKKDKDKPQGGAATGTATSSTPATGKDAGKTAPTTPAKGTTAKSTPAKESGSKGKK